MNAGFAWHSPAAAHATHREPAKSPQRELYATSTPSDVHSPILVAFVKAACKCACQPAAESNRSAGTASGDAPLSKTSNAPTVASSSSSSRVGRGRSLRRLRRAIGMCAVGQRDRGQTKRVMFQKGVYPPPCLGATSACSARGHRRGRTENRDIIVRRLLASTGGASCFVLGAVCFLLGCTWST